MLKCVQGVTSHIEEEIPFLVLEYTFIYGFLIYIVYFILLVRFLNRKSGHTCSEKDEAAREDGLATHRALAPAIGQHDHAVAAVLAHAAVAAPLGHPLHLYYRPMFSFLCDNHSANEAFNGMLS